MQGTDNIRTKISNSNIGGDFVNRDMYHTTNINYNTTINLLTNTSHDDMETSEPVGEYPLDSTSEYIDKWNSPLFLHRKSYNQLTLKDAYIPLEYTLDDKWYDDLYEHLDSFISGEQRMMLILGSPGIGKTSTVAYLAYKYRDNENVSVIKFSRLVDKAKGMGLHEFLKKEFAAHGMSLENRVLVLDGFDEINYSGDSQELLRNLKLDITRSRGLKVIVTSRENYVDVRRIRIKNTIQLQPFSDSQIKDFYEILFGKEMPAGLTIENNDVLGIPVILYMALTVGVEISAECGRAELYEKIFAFNGGIFDRFDIDDISYDGKDGAAHPVAYIKEKFLTILQQTAFSMFTRKEPVITKAEYLNIVSACGINGSERMVFDFPIKNLYDEGKNIEFVHRSVYEYFTAGYIYDMIKIGIDSEDREKLAGIFSWLFHVGEMSDEIRGYLSHKLSVKITLRTERFVLDTFRLMLNKGMTCYSLNDDRTYFGNTLECEMFIFKNMLEIIHIYKSSDDRIDFQEDKDRLVYYINHIHKHKLEINLSYTDLSYTDLSRADLSGADLSGANLSGAVLSFAVLSGANLNYADLSYTDLNHAVLGGADLSRADLSRANLRDADLSFADLSRANLRDADLSGADLRYANLRDADLSHADLSRANLRDADLSFADLSRADLRYANLSFADLSRADLSRADLSRADLSRADLSRANLRDADLSGAVLSGAVLSGAVFSASNINIIETKCPDQVSDVLVEVEDKNSEDGYKTIPYPEYKKFHRRRLFNR